MLIGIHPVVKNLGYQMEGIFLQRVVPATNPTDVRNIKISLWNTKTQETFLKDSYTVQKYKRDTIME